MKTNSFIIALSVLVMSVACTKETLPIPELVSNSYDVVVKTYSNSPAFELTWDYTGGTVDVDKTYLQFSDDKEFVETYVASASGNSYLVTYRDIQKMNAVFGQTSDFILYVRLLVEGEGVQSVYSKKIKINIDLP